MISDFFYAALPWVTCGLMVAVITAGSFSAAKIKTAGDEVKALRRRSRSFYIASALMYFTAMALYLSEDHGTSSSVTWMCIGSMFLCFGSVDTMKANAKEKEKDNTKRNKSDS